MNFGNDGLDQFSDPPRPSSFFCATSVVIGTVKKQHTFQIMTKTLCSPTERKIHKCGLGSASGQEVEVKKDTSEPLVQ